MPVLRWALAFAVLLATAWGAPALWFRGPGGRRKYLCLGAWLGLGACAVAAALVPGGPGLRVTVLAAFVVAWLGLLGWWRRIRPSHERDWAADVARLLDSRVDGDRVTLANVRDFVWRTRADFDARWQTRRYNLAELASVDLLVSYWMGPTIAHTLVSFGFSDGRQVVFSVEVRRTRGQAFSVLGGFFKQAELAIVAADERDIVRTRSNVRGEAVYIYRVGMPAHAIRALFLAYLRQADALRARPRFYNTLFSNCTTLVFDMVRRIVPGLPRDIRLIASGYLPEYIYDLGALDTSRDFVDLKRRGYINNRALACDRGAGGDTFSRAVRRGVPAADGRLILPE